MASNQPPPPPQAQLPSVRRGRPPKRVASLQIRGDENRESPLPPQVLQFLADRIDSALTYTLGCVHGSSSEREIVQYHLNRCASELKESLASNEFFGTSFDYSNLAQINSRLERSLLNNQNQIVSLERNLADCRNAITADSEYLELITYKTADTTRRKQILFEEELHPLLQNNGVWTSPDGLGVNTGPSPPTWIKANEMTQNLIASSPEFHSIQSSSTSHSLQELSNQIMQINPLLSAAGSVASVVEMKRQQS